MIVEVKQSINPLPIEGDDSELKREKKESEIMLSNYYGDKDVEVCV